MKISFAASHLSGFLPQSKNINMRWIENSELTVGVGDSTFSFVSVTVGIWLQQTPAILVSGRRGYGKWMNKFSLVLVLMSKLCRFIKLGDVVWNIQSPVLFLVFLPPLACTLCIKPAIMTPRITAPILPSEGREPAHRFPTVTDKGSLGAFSLYEIRQKENYVQIQALWHKS